MAENYGKATGKLKTAIKLLGKVWKVTEKMAENYWKATGKLKTARKLLGNVLRKYPETACCVVYRDMENCHRQLL